MNPNHPIDDEWKMVKGQPGAEDKPPVQLNIFGGEELPPVRTKKNIITNTSATRAEMSSVVGHNIALWSQPPCETDEEVADRLDVYFRSCAASGVPPTVEGMALALGTNADRLLKWQNGQGCSATRKRLITQGKAILQAIDAELAMTGKYTPVTYIFRAKSWYGMREDQNINITVQNPLGEAPNPAELAARIGDAVIIDTDYEDTE